MQAVKESVMEQWHAVRAMNKRELAHQLLNVLLVGASALMIWKGLIAASNTESPVVVVLSGSMEPAFYRGDILFLWMSAAPLAVGDIVVYKVKEKETPIIHRIVEVHYDANGEPEYLTKGDHNPFDDTALYSPGVQYLNRTHMVGRATTFLPYVGHLTIQLTDHPYVKYLVLALMAVFILTTKE